MRSKAACSSAAARCYVQYMSTLHDTKGVYESCTSAEYHIIYYYYYYYYHYYICLYIYIYIYICMYICIYVYMYVCIWGRL